MDRERVWKATDRLLGSLVSKVSSGHVRAAMGVRIQAQGDAAPAFPSTTSFQGNQVWGHREEGNRDGGDEKDVGEVEGAGVVAPSRSSSVAGTLHA